MSYVFPEDCMRYAELQHPDIRRDPLHFDKRSDKEWSAIDKWVSRDVRSVLDLGCGLGRVAVKINLMLHNDSITYYVADSTNIYANDARGGYPADDEYYNDIRMTIAFCKANGIEKLVPIDLNTTSISDLGVKFDLIVSMGAVGFHWPIKDYVDDFVATAAGKLILGVRPMMYKKLPIQLQLVERIKLEKEHIVVCKKVGT